MTMLIWIAHLFATTGFVKEGIAIVVRNIPVQALIDLNFCVLSNSGLDILKSSRSFILGGQSYTSGDQGKSKDVGTSGAKIVINIRAGVSY